MDHIINLALSLVASHHQLIEGAVLGFAAAHVPQAVGFVFSQAMKIPALRALVLRDPSKAKAFIHEVADELDKDIDAEAAKNAPPPESHQ